ncbi:cystinosin homolog [Artemia franciscana]|uniref:Cystinosin n=1 Tax=Artemia franciscana TaxID=6661 RepID=A0AA88H7D2_ARTSF|nr:hypothetical protein QYM36_019789 [Artemia franciscana]
MLNLFLCFLGITAFIKSYYCTEIYTESQDVSIVIGETAVSTFHVREPDTLNESLPIYFTSDNPDVITEVSNITIFNDTDFFNVVVTGKAAGHTTLEVITDIKDIDLREAFLRVTVIRSYDLWIVCLIVGWVYFAAWSLSFYPQIVENYQRKSVVGLSLDLVVLNFWGHTVYGLFNFGLYWIPQVKREYFNIHPLGVQPVQLNDCMFSLHAIVAAGFTFAQCFVYERTEGLSVFAWTFLGVTVTFLSGCVSAVLLDWMSWLTFLYQCSYVKLAVTSTKYVPQAFLNYKRKSTEGWSIGNVLLDFTGGLLSIMQMFFLAYNNDDWDSIFGDPTKFGLGAVSVLFDILFILQHYVWYRRDNDYEPVGQPVQEDEEEESNEIET